jgi:oligoendopeptidase F
MNTITRTIAAMLFAGVTTSAAWSQTSLSISAEAARYQFDLRRNFFASPAAEVSARADVLRDAAALTDLAGRLETPAQLREALETEDRMLRAFRRHDLYLFLRYATDIRRESELAAADELRTPVRTARRTLQQATLAKSAAWLDAAIAEQPQFARYRFYFDTTRRNAAHALAPEQVAVVSALEPLLGAGGDYPRVVSALGASDITAYAAQRDLFAFMLARTVESSNALARLRGHDSAVAEATFDAYVTESNYQAVLDEIARHGDYYKDWQRRNADPLGGAAHWRPSQAIDAIVDSAGALGPDYRREFAALLERRNGRADLGGGENRLPLMGTASVYPIGTSAIYMQAYQGTLLDLVVLAHEGGHAVQAQLMHANNVPMVYAAGPGYFTESFGRFQELLLLDHLHRTTTELALKAQMRDALAARLMAVFPSAEEAAVELAIHRGVSDGSARTADQLDAAALAAGSRYSLEYERSPERRGIWMLSEGYYMAPMQELHDAYASLLAVRYFALYRQDPARFRTAYLALLSRGYDDEPRALLLGDLGIDMMSDTFTAETMASLRAEVEAL